jgi:hypothetical protein
MMSKAIALLTRHAGGLAAEQHPDTGDDSETAELHSDSHLLTPHWRE